MVNRFINVTTSPTMIVGECPGKQRKRDANNQVFHGNRTGDFIESIIEGKSNIILTNANNFPQTQSTLEGAVALHKLISVYRPAKIICLGRKAKRVLGFYVFPRDVNVKYFDHPSYRLRFNKNVDEYRQQLINEL
jgi:hypothetical protein